MRGRAAFLALLAAPGLMAQSLEVGAQLTLAKPVMDVDGGPWFKGRGAAGFGLMAPWHLTRDQALVFRLDKLNVKNGQVNLVQSDNSQRLYTETAKVQVRSAGMDYDFFFRSEEEGLYAGCGLAYAQARFSDQLKVKEDAGVPAPSFATDQTKKAVQYALLMGWKFNPNFGLEFRFTQGNYKDVGTPGTLVKAPVFGLSLTAEF